MSSKFFTLFCGLLLSGLLLGQSSASNSTSIPIKYRLLLTSAELQNVNSDEIVITLNAFNTGRNPIDLYQFNSVPDEMEIKFEESFYRSNLSEMQDEIIASLINRNITIANGKILRNLKFNLQSTPDLYKELTKSEKKYSRSYSSKNKKRSPKLKYKTKTKKSSKGSSDLFAKTKNKKPTSRKNVKNKSDETEIAIPIEKVVTPSSSTKAEKIAESKRKTNKGNSSVPETPIISTVENTEKENVEKEEKVNMEKEKKVNILAKQRENKLDNEKAKKESYEIEKASQKEEQKKILDSLGANKKEEDKVAFDTRAGVEESKNSYAAKSACPDMVFKNVKILKKTKNFITVEYTLENLGKGPAYLGNNSNSTAIAIRAFLSSSEKISRGSLPLGGGFISYSDKKNEGLKVDDYFTGTLKLEIKKMTRFTPYVILNFDPFNALEECSKTNNYGNIKVEN